MTTRNELITHAAIQAIPKRIEALTAAVTRVAEAVEFAADKEPPKKEANDGD